ncbi:hypothetical protein GGTG_04292 [Gaeumannomyces tritici R3-111a-1]|uniref:Uncharacterized protein n=1 Tax=Gaeumannomyces tritici (strain R3-111a-1) TaxID=644352 RepID=J3NSP3_GAET3|nr:hypothetical protein GGTG_04292 [Gaeumannomyces tritici R3-111a-1]EJT79206.1 hypothetical protein GGTG_04292 [Gaeumannomyces tritici R3-111a-1]
MPLCPPRDVDGPRSTPLPPGGGQTLDTWRVATGGDAQPPEFGGKDAVKDARPTLPATHTYAQCRKTIHSTGTRFGTDTEYNSGPKGGPRRFSQVGAGNDEADAHNRWRGLPPASSWALVVKGATGSTSVQNKPGDAHCADHLKFMKIPWLWIAQSTRIT